MLVGLCKVHTGLVETPRREKTSWDTSFIREGTVKSGMDILNASNGSKLGPSVGSCIHGHETSGSNEGTECLG
jgi:hypothetical protein